MRLECKKAKTTNTILCISAAFLLLCFLHACSLANPEKSLLNFKKIDSIQIRDMQTTSEDSIRLLTDFQIKKFVSKWNNSRSTGSCGVEGTYNYTITDTLGETMQIRSNLNIFFKPDIDWCYTIKDSTYNEDLFKIAGPGDPDKKELFDKLQGRWTHSEDTTAILVVNNYKCSMYNVGGKMRNPDDDYTISFPDSLPEFINSTTASDELFVLTNRDEKLEYEILTLTDSTLSISYLPILKLHLYTKKYYSKK